MYLFLKFKVIECEIKPTFLYSYISGACYTSNTLPPADYCFQNAPLTSEGCDLLQFNRFWMAIVSQTKPIQRAQNACNHQEIIVF
ncbi:hypothetical protein AERO9A_370158 [Aeromonas salmonicida]|nr:hypothetical protein AERO9A_370158 [Aeromonas salmonicida]